MGSAGIVLTKDFVSRTKNCLVTDSKTGGESMPGREGGL